MLTYQEKRAAELAVHKENGFDVQKVNHGQKRPYGDTFYEFIVTTTKPYDEVVKYCTEKVCPCSLPHGQWAKENKETPSASLHFRNCYKLTKRSENEYFYQVISQYTG